MALDPTKLSLAPGATPPNYLGAPVAPPQAPAAPVAPGATGVQGSEMSGLIDLLHQSMQQQGENSAARNALQSGAMFGRHLGMGGGEMTKDNPMGDAGGSPFAAGGLFHGGFAANMDPAALRQSQGNTAMNQWHDLMTTGHSTGAAPSPTGNAEAAVGASQQPFHISPADQALVSHANHGATPAVREPDLYDVFNHANANQTIPHATMPRSRRPGLRPVI